MTSRLLRPTRADPNRIVVRATKMVKGKQVQKLFVPISQAKKDIAEAERKAKQWEEEKEKEIRSGAFQTKETVSEFTLSDLAEGYLEFAETRFIRLTFEQKRRAFREFFTLFNPQQSVREVGPGEAEQFMTAKVKSGLTKDTVNRLRKNLRAAWNWGIRQRICRENPWQLVEPFRVEKAVRYVPPIEDFDKVLAACEGQDRVMLLTFLHTGGRRTAVFSLQWERDIDFKQNTIKLWSRKQTGDMTFYLVPMSGLLRDELLAWANVRRSHTGTDCRFVFVNLDKTPLCNDVYGQPFVVRSHWLKKMCREVGVKEFTFHCIRHLTATELLRKGLSLEFVQAIMGHLNKSTTYNYVKTLAVTSDQLKNALDDTFKDLGGAESADKVIRFRRRA